VVIFCYHVSVVAASKTNFAFERDKSRVRNAANSGHSATIGEISVGARLCGGAGRTRTSNQTIISRSFEAALSRLSHQGQREAGSRRLAWLRQHLRAIDRCSPTVADVVS
jgi:hypothetical protein